MKSKDIVPGEDYLLCASNTWNSRHPNDRPAPRRRVKALVVGGWEASRFHSATAPRREFFGREYATGGIHKDTRSKKILVAVGNYLKAVPASHIRGPWEETSAEYDAAAEVRRGGWKKREELRKKAEGERTALVERAKAAGVPWINIYSDNVIRLPRDWFENTLLPLLEHQPEKENDQ